MMKIKRKKILWIRLLVYSLAMGAGTFLVHQKWDEQARATFKTALLQELQKRDTLSIPYISNWTAISALEEVNPGVVEIALDSGKRKYEIPCFKFENSLVKGGIQRGLLTALLDESPLDVDSLHGTWNKLLKESDIFISTSISEGFSLVICEALVLGIPIVATNTAGALELLEGGEYGVITEQNDLSIYVALKKYITDETLRTEYHKKSLLRANIFEVQSVMSRFYEVIQ